MPDPKFRHRHIPKPFPWGPSCRRLTRDEVARAYPGLPIHPHYGESAVIATGLPTEKPAATQGQRRHRDTNRRRRAMSVDCYLTR